MLEHDRFLLLELDPNSDAYNYRAQPVMQPSKLDGRRKTHDKNPCVDGMTDKPVRPGLYQFVSLLKPDVAAPVAGERPAGPYRNAQPNHANRRANPWREEGVWRESEIPWIRHIDFCHGECADDHRNTVGQGGRIALALSRGLDGEPIDEPIDQQGQPARKNDEAGNGHA